MSIKSAIKKEVILPSPTSWLILVGEKYYYRMQPVPWVYKKIDLKCLQKEKF
jgi:hypothetical protein